MIDQPPMLVYRFSRVVYRCGLHRVGYLISWFNRLLFSAWIPASAEIGRGVRFGYWGLGVVVHHRCVIGDGCMISQGVTLGRNLDRDGVPRLGDRVYVGPNAVLFGAIVIGDDAIVGAGSIVRHDVPARAVVAGNPARVLRIREIGAE